MDTLVKQPNERRRYTMDFAPRLLDGEAVQSIDSIGIAIDSYDDAVDPESIVLPTNDGQSSNTSVVQVWLLGGTDLVIYKVTIIVTGDLGTVAEGEGLLAVVDL